MKETTSSHIGRAQQQTALAALSRQRRRAIHPRPEGRGFPRYWVNVQASGHGGRSRAGRHPLDAHFSELVGCSPASGNVFSFLLSKMQQHQWGSWGSGNTTGIFPMLL